jgi:hypothetical protein
MKCRLSVVVFMAAVVTAQVGCAPSELNDEDSAVLRAVVARFCRNDEPQKTVLSRDALDVVAQGLPGPRGNSEPWANLTARGGVREQLPSDLGCSGLRTARERTIARAFGQSDAIPPKWHGFYQQFPGAEVVMRLSVPGYSQDRKAAVVLESSLSCDGFCSFGNYFKLERHADAWAVTEVETAWIS